LRARLVPAGGAHHRYRRGGGDRTQGAVARLRGRAHSGRSRQDPPRPACPAGSAAMSIEGALRAAALVAVVMLGGLRAARAQDLPNDTVVHRVRQGDSLELIAAEFYGDRTKAVFIMVANKMTHVRPLRPGERLRVPISREVATSPGDTFESLAATWLGSARRGPFLASFNGLSSDDGLPAGAVLTIPFTI